MESGNLAVEILVPAMEEASPMTKGTSGHRHSEKKYRDLRREKRKVNRVTRRCPTKIDHCWNEELESKNLWAEYSTAAEWREVVGITVTLYINYSFTCEREWAMKIMIGIQWTSWDEIFTIFAINYRLLFLFPKQLLKKLPQVTLKRKPFTILYPEEFCLSPFEFNSIMYPCGKFLLIFKGTKSEKCIHFWVVPVSEQSYDSYQTCR